MGTQVIISSIVGTSPFNIWLCDICGFNENCVFVKTTNENTWCPGCPNHMILESAKRAIAKLITEGKKQEDFAMATGIGCHAKIFDYINISGIYGLHGRVIPTALGIKLGNPNLNVFP